jgi:hypothetical protein
MIEELPTKDVSNKENYTISDQNMLTRIEENALIAFSSIATALSSLPILSSQSAIVITSIVLMPFFEKILETTFLPVLIIFALPPGVTILASLIIIPINIVIFYVAHYVFCKVFKNPKTEEKGDIEVVTEIKEVNSMPIEESEKESKTLDKKVEKIDIENLEAKKKKKLLLRAIISAVISALVYTIVITIVAIVSLFIFTIDPILSFPFIFLGLWLLLSCSIGVITNIISFNVISRNSTNTQKQVS